MIVVHHLENSRSQRVLWLLEELHVPYEVKRYARNKKTMLAPPELKAVHPLGKSPVLVDDRAPGGITVAESGAIVEYLVETYGAGRLVPPAGTEERRRYTFWLHYAEGSAMTPLLLTLIFSEMPKAPAPFFVRPILKAISKKVQSTFVDPQLALHLGFIESELGKFGAAGWFAGEDFTAADVQMSFPAEGASARGGLGAAYPRIRAFLDRIHARPAYQKALERGGPYELLK